MSMKRKIQHLLFAVGVLLSSQACSSTSQAVFTCSPGVEINEGLELSIDVLVVSDSEEQQIRQLADEWFYSDLRRSLGARRQTVSVSSNCPQKGPIVIPKLKEQDRLAIIADFKFEGRGRTKSQMEFYGKDYWRGQTIQVRVFDRYLTISQGR